MTARWWNPRVAPRATRRPPDNVGVRVTAEGVILVDDKSPSAAGMSCLPGDQRGKSCPYGWLSHGRCRYARNGWSVVDGRMHPKERK